MKEQRLKNFKCLLRHAVHTSNKSVLLNCEIALSNFSNNRTDIAPLTPEELWARCCSRSWYQQNLVQPKHRLQAEHWKIKETWWTTCKCSGWLRLMIKVLYLWFSTMTYSSEELHCCVQSCVWQLPLISKDSIHSTMNWMYSSRNF